MTREVRLVACVLPVATMTGVGRLVSCPLRVLLANAGSNSSVMSNLWLLREKNKVYGDRGHTPVRPSFPLRASRCIEGPPDQLNQENADLVFMIQADMTGFHLPGEPLQLGLPATCVPSKFWISALPVTHAACSLALVLRKWRSLSGTCLPCTFLS